MDTEAILHTWTSLNDFLRSATEAECKKLLAVVKRKNFSPRPKKQARYTMRIFSKINHLRLQRERAELS